MLQSVHVNNVAQEHHGSKEEVFLNIAEAGGCFIAAVQAMGLEVSAKSVILSSSMPLQNSLIHFFRHSYGVELQPAGTAPNLDFSRSSGKTNTVKPFSILKKRFSKANLRAIRSAWLARKSAKALSLFTPGVTTWDSIRACASTWSLWPSKRQAVQDTKVVVLLSCTSNLGAALRT